MPDNPVLVRMLRRTAQAGVFLLMLYLTLIGGFAPGVREYRWRMTTLCVLGLLWGSWFAWKLLRRADLPTTQLELPLLTMLGATLISSILSVDPRASMDTLLRNAGLVVAFYFTLDWMSQNQRADLLIRAVLLTGGVVCLIGFLELWQWYGGTWISPVSWRESGLSWSPDRSLAIKSTMHNPNILGYYLILLIGLASYKLSQSKTGWRRGLWAGYLIMAMGAEILTQSRGAQLAAAASIVLYTALFLRSRFDRRPSEWTTRARQAALGAILLALAVLVVLLLITGLPLGAEELWETNQLGGRNYIWGSAVQIVLAHPIVGTGPGNFALSYIAYRNHDWANNIFSHAHNLILTIAAEYGLLGVMAVAFFLLVLGRLIVSYGRQTRPANWAPEMVIGVGILAGQGIHNMVDGFLDYPILPWFTIVSVTLCLQPLQGQRSRSSPHHHRHARLFLLGACLLTLLAGALWSGRGFAAYDQARAAAQAGDWPEAVDLLERSVDLDPAYSFYRQQLALAYGELARTDSRFLSRALEQQELVHEQNSSYPPDVAYLSCLYWKADQRDQAIDLMEKAIAATPDLPGFYYSYHLSQPAFNLTLGHYLEAIGRVDLARQAYARVLLDYPQAGTSPYWQVDEQHRHMLQTAARMARHATSKERLAIEIALNSGDYGGALEVSTASPGSQLAQARALVALGRLAEARELLYEAEHATTAQSLADRARILTAVGDLVQAESSILQAIALAPRGAARSIHTPSYHYLRGRLAELEGNVALAEDSYRQSIALATSVETNYAHLVGRREPLPTQLPFCLLIPYPADNLSSPSLALAELMTTRHSPSEAMEVYHNLLRYEPFNQDAMRCLTGDIQGGCPSSGRPPLAYRHAGP
jgi:putative inorganic carbon (HCO3(-)) transporter